MAQLSVEHFMAPNLALLVDTLSGSDIQKLGPMIMKRLHDSNWEVRDTVLELLASMANISLASESCHFCRLVCVYLCVCVYSFEILIEVKTNGFTFVSHIFPHIATDRSLSHFSIQ